MNYFNKHISKKTVSKEEQILRLKSELTSADAIVIGAGAGLSTSAGFTYSGERFEKYFFDFAKKYGINDMYSGGFYPFEDVQTRWAWWARNIYFNRYVKSPKPVYDKLFSLVKDKNYFIITTNVDHQFQKAGFDKKRLFYTQGDYGLFQSVNHDIKKTYDNEDWVMKAMEAQGFVKDNTGVFTVPENKDIVMHIPIELIPKCPDDGLDMTLNLRTLYLELGVGANTPVIVKYPFWQMTNSNEKAVYACINYGEAFCPREIEDRSICIDGDIGEILNKIV